MKRTKKHHHVISLVTILAIVLSAAAARVFISAQATSLAEEPGERVSATTFIAFASVRADDNYEIFLMNPDGSGVRRVTYLPADDLRPSVSRDGSKIAFISNRAVEAADHSYDIYVMNSDGTNVTRATTGGFAGLSPSVINLTWNPGGTKLAFSKFVSGVGHIYTVDIATRVLTDLTPSTDSQMPDWSPDGTRIAFMRNAFGNGYGLCIMNSDGSNQVAATWGALGGGSLSSPKWSPDGARIAYIQSGGIGFADAITGSNKKLLSKASGATTVSWSPDGQSLTYLVGSANPDIFLVDIADSQSVRLTRKGALGSNQRGEDSPSFGAGSPNVTAPLVGSGRIAFIGGQTAFGVHTMNADFWDDRFVAPLSRTSTVGSETRSYAYTDPSFSRDGSKLVLVRATTVNGAFLERDIAVMDSDGSNERVIRVSGNESLPQMSADNSKILFLTDRFASGCSAYCTAVATISAGGDGSDVSQTSVQASMVLDFDLSPNGLNPAFTWGGAYYRYGVSSTDFDLHNDIHGALQYIGYPAQWRDNQSAYPINGSAYPPDGYFLSFESPAWIANGDRIAYIKTHFQRDTSVPGNVTQYVEKSIVSVSPGAAAGIADGQPVGAVSLYSMRLPGNAQGLPQLPTLGNLAWSQESGKLVFSHDSNIVSTMSESGANIQDFYCPNIVRPIGWVPATSGPLAPVTTYTIAGTVRNAQNVVLANASVNLSGGFTAGTTTDAAGNYIFTALPAGLNYTVTVSSGSLTFSPSVGAITNLSGDMTLNFSAAAPTPTPTPTATPTPTPTPSPAVQLGATAYNGAESVGSVQVQITRSGSTASVVTVNYTTSNTAGTNDCSILHTGAASSRCDYETTMGTVTFAAGETSKTIGIPVIDDSYAEGDETFTVTLSNPVGASLASPGSSVVTIFDNETVNGTNPIDQATSFVRIHYTDFLSREPDPSGLAFWSGQITDCGSNPTCIELRRINGSGAFFLSIEFQETGYLVYRFYKAGYGNITGLPVPLRLNEFLPDTQQIGKGVVVGVGAWQTQLEANKQNFAVDFVTRTRFTTAYANSMTPAQFVDALFLKASVTPTAADRAAAIGEFGTAATSADTAARGRALRRVAENATLNSQEFNKAFVLMQYFGYLRRNPDDAPDANFGGYNFWLGKLNQFNGNYINAEMVKAFIAAAEYRARFGTN